MHLRGFLLIAALALATGCGTTVDPDGGPDGPTGEQVIATITTADLERALPVKTDLPDGFTEAEPAERAENSDYEPSIGCEAFATFLEHAPADDAGVIFHVFVDPDEVLVTTSVAVADDGRRSSFAGIGSQMEGCDQMRTTADGDSADVAIGGGPVELGDEGFVAQMILTFPEQTTKVGLTLVSVLHGDVSFSVQVVDGFDDDGNLTARDPEQALALATAIDQRLTLMLGE